MNIEYVISELEDLLFLTEIIMDRREDQWKARVVLQTVEALLKYVKMEKETLKD